MARRVRVVLDHEGMRELLDDEGVREHLTDLAEMVLDAAIAGAPFESGDYRDNLHIEQDTTDRAAVRVVGDTDHSLVVEARTGNLARALDAVVGGGDVKRQYTTRSGKKIWATQAQIANWTRGW